METQTLNFSVKDTNIVKGIAICWMLFHHCFLSADRYAGFTLSFAPFTEGQIQTIAKFGKICVAIFIFLSAYGMMKSFSEKYSRDSKGTERFMLRRYLKMMSGFWPVYVVAVIGCAIFAPASHGVIVTYGTGAKGVINALVDLSGLSYLFSGPSLIHTWWYLSLAIVLILLFPLFVTGYRKMGWLFAVLMTFLPYFVGSGDLSENLWRWLAVAVWGIVCADLRVFERIKGIFLSWGKGPYMLCAVGLCILWVPMLYLRKNFVGEMATVVDSVIVVFIVLFGYVVLAAIPGINSIFAFLGKHSMNIFLIHTFIRTTWFKSWTYSFGNVFLIWLMLLLESLAFSVLLEWVKRKSRYDTLWKKLLKRVEG